MFWGLIMEPGRCYTQTVKSSFHVSMAALDISNSTNEAAQVMCVFEGRNYLLCTLNKHQNLTQVPLDLNFVRNTKVSFATNGKSHVHLTGYLLSQFDEDGEEQELFEEEEEVFDDPPLKKRSKRLAALGGPPQKKAKNDISSDALEEESSDSDFEIDAELEKTQGSEEEEEEEDASDDDEAEETDENEFEDDESDEVEDEENEDDEASSLSGDDDDDKNGVVIKPVEKPKQNGTPKPATPKQKGNKTPEKIQPKEKPKKQEKQPKNVVLKGGVIISDLKDGTGPVLQTGKFAHVYYEGRLKNNNKVFDATNKGPGFAFKLGAGDVITGWDVGLVGMKVGGKRRVTCPPGAAYGQKGSPPVIPPNSTLVFDIELRKIS